jgi:hypothetical protein
MTTNNTNSNDWFEYKRLVLAALEQSAKQNEILNKRLSDIEITIAKLNVQAGLWGAIGGIIFSAIVAFIFRKL